jgi:hypothetical protein
MVSELAVLRAGRYHHCDLRTPSSGCAGVISGLAEKHLQRDSVGARIMAVELSHAG